MNRLPRHVIAMTTIGLLAWFGISLLAVNPVLGGALLVMSALRLGLWIHEMVRRRSMR